ERAIHLGEVAWILLERLRERLARDDIAADGGEALAHRPTLGLFGHGRQGPLERQAGEQQARELARRQRELHRAQARRTRRAGGIARGLERAQLERREAAIAQQDRKSVV